MEIDDTTPIWNLNGAQLSVSALAAIAETLQRTGSVLVRNVAVNSAAPIVGELGFKIVHGTEPEQYLIEAVPLDQKESHP